MPSLFSAESWLETWVDLSKQPQTNEVRRRMREAENEIKDHRRQIVGNPEEGYRLAKWEPPLVVKRSDPTKWPPMYYFYVPGNKKGPAVSEASVRGYIHGPHHRGYRRVTPGAPYDELEGTYEYKEEWEQAGEASE